jgi:hypothetical protein
MCWKAASPFPTYSKWQWAYRYLISIVTAIGGGGVVYALGQSVVEDLRHKFKR